MFRVLPIAGVLVLSACAGATPGTATEPERSTVETQLPGVSAAAAIEKVKAAFVAEGLQIADASSAGVVTSVPVNPTPYAAVSTTFTYRATVLASDSGSRVVFSSSFRDGRPVTSRASGMLREHGWLRLERLKAALN